MNAALEAINLSAGYQGRAVLRDLSLRLERGEMAALLGPNGTGKSTLLQAVTGLLPAMSGEARLFGRNVASIPALERAALTAVMPQHLSTPLAFTVAEMAMMGRSARLGRWGAPTKRDLAVVEEAMAYTDTIELRARRFATLSGGERQRVAIAMALAGEPQLLLLDEPTSHLDMSHRVEIAHLLRRINAERGTTVMMIAHDLNLAAEFFPRLILLAEGGVVADGKPTEALREETLRAVYHCAVTLQRDSASGVMRIFPRIDIATNDQHPSRLLHLICGGGSGETLLRRLTLMGHRLTCGVTNERDSDAICAAALNLPQVLERPFSPISEAALARARAMAAAAEALIVAELPFGDGNVANLCLAEEARRSGRRVLLNVAHLESRDFTSDRSALPRLQALLANGAEAWQELTELTKLVAPPQ